MHFVLGPEVAENQFSYIFSEVAIPLCLQILLLRRTWFYGFRPKALMEIFESGAGKQYKAHIEQD